MFSQWCCLAKHRAQLSVLCVVQSSQGWHRRERSVRSKKVSFQLTQTRGDVCEEVSQAVRGIHRPTHQSLTMPSSLTRNQMQRQEKLMSPYPQELHADPSQSYNLPLLSSLARSGLLTSHYHSPDKAQHGFLSYHETQPHEPTCFWKIKSWGEKKGGGRGAGLPR